jgi:hypothetical protein
MHRKSGFYILLAALGLASLVSCLGGTDEYDYVVSTDAQLASFSLSHDSLTALAETKFSIDQKQGLIYNYDSLPYLTDTAKIASRAIVAYVAGSGASASIRLQYPDNDTAWVASGDSMRLASEFYLKLYSPSGRAKTYTVSINVHQMDPDSVQYHPFNGAVPLYDLPPTLPAHWSEWTQHCPDTLEVVAGLGFLKPSDHKGLALVVKVKDKDGLRFAFTPDLVEYRLGATIPEGFPVARFSILNDSAFAGRLTVVSSLQSVWATEDGLYWANLFDTREPLPVIEGGNAFYYNGEIWFLNGRIVGGEYNPKVYYSRDGGRVWKEKPTKAWAPSDYMLREDAWVVVDAEGKYFYIINGRQGELAVVLPTWRVALNRKVFDH